MAKAAPRVRNVVFDDAIWRQTIQYEEITAKTWESNWGFMKDTLYEDKPSQSAPKLPALQQANPANGGAGRPAPKKTFDPRFRKYQLPADRFNANEPVLPALPDEATTNLLMAYDILRVAKKLTPVEKSPYPRTTMQDIGWLWKNVRGYKYLGVASKDARGARKEETKDDDQEAGGEEPTGEGVTGSGRIPSISKLPSPYVTLEIYGKHARGRDNILRWWGGTRESMP
ncbi:MAG: hypothetical protein BJ554DRAFT_1971 [Olpidium bornovanus]|uniref:Uncharacterized protein n=1 Tax=Olpidium bornovanus TaxID=278681 RepID=A0A8H7ZRU2_9FUNG|nr:MAG: hypothetical protein BJ554DRAFT_1971 [Olpidium bornovanus]